MSSSRPGKPANRITVANGNGQHAGAEPLHGHHDHSEEAEPIPAAWDEPPLENESSLDHRLEEASENARALYKVVEALVDVTEVDETVLAAIDTVREAFGWTYGSYWSMEF